MDWKRRRQISIISEGILENNFFNRPPIELIYDIMKQRGIIFEERNEDDDEFCGVYIVIKEIKIIFVNSNMYAPRKNFTIAHELGHHFLCHTLQNGAILCDKNAVFGNNKPESEKEADYFAACFLMPKSLMEMKNAEFEKNYVPQISLFLNSDTQEKNKQRIEYLSNFFQVSKEAMEYRLEELKIIK